MATYQEPNYLTRVANAAFSQDHAPGNIAPWAGIYRCTGCQSYARKLVTA